MDVGYFQTHDYSTKPKLLVSALAVMSAIEFCDNAGISNIPEKLPLQVFCTLQMPYVVHYCNL